MNSQQQPGIFPDLEWRMPVLELTDYVYDRMIGAGLNGTEMKLSMIFLGNRDTKKNTLTRFTIAQLSKKVGKNANNFYGDDGYIANIKKTGLFKFKWAGPKLGGRFIPEKKRKKGKQPYPLKKAFIHTTGLNMLFATTSCRIDITLFLLLSLHTDRKSGQLNTEKRAGEWADNIGCARITAERAIDKLLESGVWQIERDYSVQGVHNFVQMGEGYMTLWTERDIERKKKEKIEKVEMEVDYRQIEIDLHTFFGINATGWLKQHLDRALSRILFFREEHHKQRIAAVKLALENDSQPAFV